MIDLMGTMLRRQFQSLRNAEGVKSLVLNVPALGENVSVYLCLKDDVWKPGRAFHNNEKKKSYLVWTCPNEQLRLISDGYRMTVQQLKSG